jgi:hypothetical protein
MSRGSHEWLRIDRLDERWREPAPEPAAPALPAVTDDPIAWCARLSQLGRERFGAGAPIVRVIDELCRLVGARCADALDPAVAAALDADIAEYVGHVEDLADIAGRGSR